MAVGVVIEHFGVSGGGATLAVVSLLLSAVGALGMLGRSPIKGPLAWFIAGIGLGGYGGSVLWPP